MARVLLVLALLALVFWVYSIVDTALSPPTGQRGASKVSWLLIVILLPVIGGALWFAIGRPRRQNTAPVNAPDDDPRFFSDLGSVSDQDARIRRLEEELAALDAEDDDPRWNRTGDVPPAPHPDEPPVDADGAADDSDDSGEATGRRGSRS